MEENKALVSVIMPAYECEKYISESIESVIAQTMPDWELWIVDDCSRDHTADVVMPYTEKYPNIHFLRLAQNGGPAVARNEGLRHAEGKYIAFLDSDDRWYPQKLKKQIEYMERNKYLFCCTAYEQMDEAGNSLHCAMYPLRKVSYNKCIRLSNPIGNLTVMYNQDSLGRLQVPLIKKRNDFALWLQILKKTPYCYGMPEVLASYRVRKSGSVSSNKLAQAKYHWQLYHEIEKHSVFRCAFEMMCWAFVKGTKIGLKKRAYSGE